jgi:RNA polymerase sigma-70 factor (ECF subfamily)
MTPPGRREVQLDTNRKHEELTEYALEVVHHKARQLVGKAGYTNDDVADIEQDLITDLLERLPKFDPSKATHNTFVARLVERKISNLLRDRLAAMRDCRREDCSLNDEIDTGDEEPPTQRVATISQDEHDLRTGKYARPAEERADLRCDIEAVLAVLPPELREDADMLAVMPITEVARTLGVPRATFYDNYLAKIRAVFEDKGLNGYLT